jgi:hypothetical protein
MSQIKEHIQYFNSYRNYLTKQQYKTLKGKLKQDDILAVRKGLNKILSRQGLFD